LPTHTRPPRFPTRRSPEPALTYRDEMRGEKGSDRIPMTFFNMHSPGLTILPTHRVLANLEGFDSNSFFNRAAEIFDATESPGRGDRKSTRRNSSHQIIAYA